jgi:hypothetical protein
MQGETMSLSVHQKQFKRALLCQAAVFYIAVTTAWGANNLKRAFIPELLRVTVSSTVVAPGNSIEMTYYWRNRGTQPAINSLVAALKFRIGDVGFFNADGGAWYGGAAGQPFQSDFCPTPPTTFWGPGMVVADQPVKVNVPSDVPDGNYETLIWLQDRGGRVPFGPLNDGIKTVKSDGITYKLGNVTVSKNVAKAKPAVWKFSPETSIASINLVPNTATIVSATQDADKGVVVGDTNFSVTLDPKRNYTLSSIGIDGRTFESGGKFPAIAVYDKTGTRSEFFPDDPRWKVTAQKRNDGYDVVYRYDGFNLKVTYTVLGDGITIAVRPIKEQNYKALLLSGGGSLITISADKPNAMSSGFILTPSGGGALIELPPVAQNVIAAPSQSWAYPASFFGFGYNGRGLIVRCPQYGGVWSYGTGDINKKFSLIGDVAVAFRPCARYFDMPLPEPVIELQLVPVRDTNQDGVFNWVDIGVKYRNQFIKRNANMDYTLRDSVFGKIDIAAGFKNTQNYRQLIEQIRTIDFAPQTIWLVGAHTPPEGNYVDPPYTEKPDPSHNGPDNYDYFAFKRDAEKIGARIGIHELFQDISQKTYDWGPSTPMKLAESGKHPRGTWGGKGWQCYAKAIHVMLADGSFQRSLDKHFKDWDVRPGDTWHWDCLTAMGGQQDYSPVHPATNGTDIRRCIEILKYIKSKGIHMTSEGLQEGMAEFCDFGWSAQINLSEPGGFKKATSVPLTPVLFQGMTYYSLSWHPAYGLLYGGKAAYEATGLDREGAIQGYFGSDVFWQKIADRTVQNMIRTKKGWRVEYTQGGTLEIDLANMTPAMTFVLTIDGEKLTPDNPPPSPWGVRAKKIEGKYKLLYPKDRKSFK